MTQNAPSPVSADDSSRDDLAHVSAVAPDVNLLIEEYYRAGGYGKYNREVEAVERHRYNRWDGQSPDGRKRREYLSDDPEPWEGASDARVPVVDGICNDLVDLCISALTRSRLEVVPTESSDVQRAGAAKQVMEYYRRRLKGRLLDEFELAAQNAAAHGLADMHVQWDRRVSRKRMDLELSTLEQAAIRSPQIAALVDAIRTPALETEAVDLLQRVAEEWSAESAQGGPYEGHTPVMLSRKRLRKIIRELRDEGVTAVPMEYVSRNEPCVTSYKFGEDIFYAASTVDIQRARCIFIRDHLSEAELRQRVLMDGWNEAAVDEALKYRGQTSIWEADTQAIKDDVFWQYNTYDTREDRVEVIWCYRLAQDEDGIPEVWCSVICPTMSAGGQAHASGRHKLHELDTRGLVQVSEEMYFAHYPVDDAFGQYDVAHYQRERLDRRIVHSRGVVDIASTWQLEAKTQVDGVVNRTQLETVPTMLVRSPGFRYRIGPGVQMQGREGDVSFMDTPKGNPALAFNVLEEVRRRSADYFGLHHPDVPVDKIVAKSVRTVARFMAFVEETHRIMFRKIQANLTTEDMQRIAGSGVDFPTDPAAIAGDYDFQMIYDAGNLVMEYVLKKLDAIVQFANAADRSGRVDWGKLMEFGAHAIDPTWAGAVLQDQPSATEAVQREVEQDFLMMFAGNEAKYTQNDPTAGLKMQIAQAVMQGNPKYQQALQTDEQFRALVENWTKNKQQSVQQLGANKMTGRTGVKPVNQ